MVQSTVFLKKQMSLIKEFLFQVIYTIAIIQKYLSSFRHNNLILENIYIIDNEKSQNILLPDFNNDFFHLDESKIKIKISGFEWSTLLPQYGNFNTKNKNILFPDKSNGYYDIYIFLKSVLKFVLQNKLLLDKATKQFFNKFLPSNIRNKMDTNVIVYLPNMILYDEYFSSYHSSKVVSGNTSSYSDNVKKTKIIVGSRLLKNIKSYTYKIKRIYKSSHLKGGEAKTNPYKEEKNDPFVTKENKNLKDSNPIHGESDKKPDTFKSYEGFKSKDDSKKSDFLKDGDDSGDKSKFHIKDKYPASIMTPLYDQSGTLINPQIPYSNIINRQVPVQKIYNVNLANPIGGIGTLNKIYEAFLPDNKTGYSFLTIYERLEVISHLRNLMINHTDGEITSISAGENSLLSYIKLLNLNPYSINANPFYDLPNNFLIYKAAYPIRYNESSRLIEIAKQSMGINVRLYMLSWGDLNCLHIKSRTNYDNYIQHENFEIWRELQYYNWVKNTILKRNVSPNFLAPILYKIDNNSQIDWSLISNLKLKYTSKAQYLDSLENSRKINKLHDMTDLGLTTFFKYHKTKIQPQKHLYSYLKSCLETKYSFLNSFKYYQQNESITIDVLIKKLENNEITCYNIITELKNYLEKSKVELSAKEKFELEKVLTDLLAYVQDDITSDSGKVLVLLTEAPTMNFYQWISPTYNVHGAIRKMISTGYHNPDVWKTIIFQLLYIFAILQKEQILFTTMTLENNFYIKDINTDPNTVGTWVYKIDEMNFYLPNYGYILVLDTKFNDIYKSVKIDCHKDQTLPHKFYSPKLFKDNISKFEEKFIGIFKEIINPNNFCSTIIKQKNAIEPDETIKTLISAIYESKLDKITDIIKKFFTEYLHNRIGTPIFKSEKEIVNLNFISDFSGLKGSLLVWQKRADEYIWVIYEDDSNILGKKKIIYKHNNNYIETTVFSGCLFTYPENERIFLDITKGNRLEEYLIYESYDFGNLHD